MHAAWNTYVNNGDTVTSTLWNDMIDKNITQDTQISTLSSNDSNNVKLTGDQTINGVKTFMNDINVNSKVINTKKSDGTSIVLFKDLIASPNNHFHFLPDITKGTATDNSILFGYNSAISKYALNSSWGGTNREYLSIDVIGNKAHLWTNTFIDGSLSLLGGSNSNVNDRFNIGNDIIFHTGGHKIIAFGWSPGTGKAAIGGVKSEVRWDPSGSLSLGIGPIATNAGDSVTIPKAINISRNTGTNIPGTTIYGELNAGALNETYTAGGFYVNKASTSSTQVGIRTAGSANQNDRWQFWANGTEDAAGIGTRTLQMWWYPYDSLNGCCQRVYSLNGSNQTIYNDWNVVMNSRLTVNHNSWQMIQFGDASNTNGQYFIGRGSNNSNPNLTFHIDGGNPSSEFKFMKSGGNLIASLNNSGRLDLLGNLVVGGQFDGNRSDAIAFEQQGTFHRIAYNDLRFYDWGGGGDSIVFSGDGIRSWNGFFVGDDVKLVDINQANTLGVYGQQNAAIGAIQLGSSGVNLRGESGVFTIGGTVKITGGSPGAGKVLTSDASGNASWQTPSGGGTSTSFGGNGSDGDVTGALTITGSNNTIIVKNYKNFIPGNNIVTTSSQNSILYIKVSGILDLRNTTINLKGKGGLGTTGTGGTNIGFKTVTGGGNGGDGHRGSPGTCGSSTRSNCTSFGGVSGEIQDKTSPLWYKINNFYLVGTGSGGGGGHQGQSSQFPTKGGNGGGAIIFEVNGDVILGNTVINVQGDNGDDANNTGRGTRGGGGGGGGGSFFILSNKTITQGSGNSFLVSGGVGGLGGTGRGYHGGGGGGGSSIVSVGTRGPTYRYQSNSRNGGKGGDGGSGTYIIESL